MNIDPGSMLLGGLFGFAAGIGTVFAWALCASAAMADEREPAQHEHGGTRVPPDYYAAPSDWRVN